MKALTHNPPVFLIDADEQIVGFANGGRNRDKASPYPGELYTIHILKAFQGYKLGRKLFEQVQADMKHKGLLPFVTFVLADNPSLGFYQHLDGKVISEHLEDFDGIKLRELQLLWE